MPAQAATLSLADAAATPVTHVYTARGVLPNAKTGELVAEWTDPVLNGGALVTSPKLRLYQSETKDGKQRYKIHLMIPVTAVVDGITKIIDQDEFIAEYRYGKMVNVDRVLRVWGLGRQLCTNTAAGGPAIAARDRVRLSS